ncbi:Ankyrin repeat domain-containing protein 61, partial [Struthio camelus australis]
QQSEGFQAISILIKHGANIDDIDKFGRTALHIAAESLDEYVTATLIAYGANINFANPNCGRTALHLASPLFSFLQRRSNLKHTALLNKLLGLSYPLRLRDNQGHLPPGLLFPEFQTLKDVLISLSKKLLSLQDICILTVRRIYGEKNKRWLKNKLPVIVWNSLFNYQDFSK